MPTPNKGESKKEFIDRCIPVLIDEGKERDQAVAQCNGIWDQSKKDKARAMDLASFSSTLLSHPWAMLPSKLEEIIDASRSSDPILKQEVFSSFFDLQDEDFRRFSVTDGIATLNLQGILTKEVDLFMMLFGGGGTSSRMLIEDFKVALGDKDVKGIFFDVESPGGDFDATIELADLVFESRGIKPMLTYTELMASGALWVGSGTDHIVIANAGVTVGSIGVVMVHNEISKATEMHGEKFTVFSAGKFKAIGNEFEALSKSDRTYIQGIVDYKNSLFVDAIARNYAVSIDTVNSKMGDGKIFIGQQALDAGLANEIANREQAMDLLKSVISGKAEFSTNTQNAKARNRLGGETLMPTLEETLQAKVMELEGKLSNETSALNIANTKLTEKDSTVVVDGLNVEIVDLKAQVAYVVDVGTLQDAKIESLEGSMSGDAKMAEIGKDTIKALKTEIMSISAQVHGDDYDEDFTKQQIDALSGGENSYESLNKMKANLEVTRSKIFKGGKLNADGNQTPVSVKDMTPEEKRNIGRVIAGGKVIPLNNTG